MLTCAFEKEALICCAWKICREKYPGAVGTQSGSKFHREQSGSQAGEGLNEVVTDEGRVYCRLKA